MWYHCLCMKTYYRAFQVSELTSLWPAVVTVVCRLISDYLKFLQIQPSNLTVFSVFSITIFVLIDPQLNCAITCL